MFIYIYIYIYIYLYVITIILRAESMLQWVFTTFWERCTQHFAKGAEAAESRSS